MNKCWAVAWAVQTLSVELTDFSVYEKVSVYLASREAGKRNDTGIELDSNFWHMCSKGRTLLITTKMPAAEGDVFTRWHSVASSCLSD